jgi:hypothetical protein
LEINILYLQHKCKYLLCISSTSFDVGIIHTFAPQKLQIEISLYIIIIKTNIYEKNDQVIRCKACDDACDDARGTSGVGAKQNLRYRC